MALKKTTSNNKAKIRREKILNAARELFFKKTYKGTTIADIAKLADYSKRSVYLDFKTKDDLFITIGLEGLEILRDTLENVRKEKLNYKDYLHKTVFTFVRFSQEYPEYFRMNYKVASPEILSNCEAAVRQEAANLEQACMQVPLDVVKVGIQEKAIPPMDPYEAAMTFIAANTGILLLAITGNQTLVRKKDIEGLVNTVTRSIMDGLQFQADQFYLTST